MHNSRNLHARVGKSISIRDLRVVLLTSPGGGVVKFLYGFWVHYGTLGARLNKKDCKF